MSRGFPRLYGDLAPWFHLLTAPADYEEEAAFYLHHLQATATRPIHTVLELGSGGGNNASHLKTHVTMALVDLSPEMLALSETLNPECEHVVGDMRSVRLDRRFDAVFVHDAVSYLTEETDLAAAVATAWVHCAPGGAVLFAPDVVTETFRKNTGSGGHDGPGRSLRYTERTWDPDPTDTEYVADMTYVLQSEGSPPETIEERHRLGMFPRATWLRLLSGAGFAPTEVPSEHSEVEAGATFVYLGHRPEAAT